MRFSTRCFGRLLGLLLLITQPGWAQSWQSVSAPVGSSTGRSAFLVATLDAAGNTVVAGNFTGTLTLGSFTLTSRGTSDLVVARRSPAGSWLQAVAVPATSSGYLTPTVLALDAAGQVLVAGTFTGTSVTFGSTTLTNASAAATTTDIFLARLNSAGQWTQAVQAGGPDRDYVTALAPDAAGNVAVGGYFYSASCRFGALSLANDDPVSPDHQADLFVTRLSAAGQWTQAARAGSNGEERVAGLALQADGSITAVGYFTSDEVYFTPALRVQNSSVLGSNGGEFATVYVARLSAAGQWVAAESSIVYGAVEPQTAVAAPNGDLVVAGRFSGGARFGSTYLIDSDRTTLSYDLFVARLAAGTTASWSQVARAGDTGSETAVGLALDGQGTAILTGRFAGTTTSFGATRLRNTTPDSATTSNKEDLYVARLARNGSWLDAVAAGGKGYDIAYGAVVDAVGILVVGWVAPPARFGALTLAGPNLGQSTGFVARLGAQALATRGGAQLPAETMVATPNPARGQTVLRLSAAGQARTLLLLDAAGREVARQRVPAAATSARLPVTGLPAGLYLVRCEQLTTRLLVE